MTITRVTNLGGYSAVNIRELRAVYFARRAYITTTITEAT